MDRTFSKKGEIEPYGPGILHSRENFLAKILFLEKKLLAQPEVPATKEVTDNQPQSFFPVKVKDDIKPLGEERTIKIRIKLRNQRLVWIEQKIASLQDLNRFLRALEEDSIC